MNSLELSFILVGICASYPHLIYPMLVMAMASLKPKSRDRGWSSAPQAMPSVSIILAAHDEPALSTRIAELRNLINSSELSGELIVVLDGHADSSISTHAGVRVIALPRRRGKAAALNAGCAAASGEILVFADARQIWDRQALRHLLAPFVDSKIGAVSGELNIASAAGIIGAVGLYWQYEKWIRKLESRLHSTVGVTGAISAVRACLYHPIPAGLILDDVYWPLRVAMAGYRTVYQDQAIARDRLPERAADEFRRKVRTQAGNFQLLQHLPHALLPWRNPLWWQFVSHKLMRLITPWALIALLGINFALLAKPLFLLILIVQCAAYGVAMWGLKKSGASFRPATAAGAFVLLNAAAWIAFWVWTLGRAGRSWNRTSYVSPVAAPAR